MDQLLQRDIDEMWCRAGQVSDQVISLSQAPQALGRLTLIQVKFRSSLGPELRAELKKVPARAG